MKVFGTFTAILSMKVDSINFLDGLRTVVLTCSLIVAVCAPAMADENDVDIEADLTGCASPCVAVPGAEGAFDYQAEFFTDGITVKGVKFRADVTIPVPNVLGITASNAGATGLVVIDLTRLNPSTQLADTYATCTMVLQKARTSFLRYTLNLSTKFKKGRFVEKSRGFCDNDLLTADAPSGIPAMRHGDIAFVSVNGADILSSPPPDACEGCWDY